VREPRIGIAVKHADEHVVAEEVRDRCGIAGRHRHDVRRYAPARGGGEELRHMLDGVFAVLDARRNRRHAQPYSMRADHVAGGDRAERMARHAARRNARSAARLMDNENV
jgi:hypothetical protein